MFDWHGVLAIMRQVYPQAVIIDALLGIVKIFSTTDSAVPLELLKR